MWHWPRSDPSLQSPGQDWPQGAPLPARPAFPPQAHKRNPSRDLSVWDRCKLSHSGGLCPAHGCPSPWLPQALRALEDGEPSLLLCPARGGHVGPAIQRFWALAPSRAEWMPGPEVARPCSNLSLHADKNACLITDFITIQDKRCKNHLYTITIGLKTVEKIGK